MKQIVLGTAGHIDHGKTSFIKALTGIDTDRLAEEKARGITIELGFASVDLPSGQRLGIVDVPGHEKFVKNMVAGATGIDIVAMVIAADEGIMPQTREHLDICSLLAVKHGMIVLTKVDMVDEEWLELVTEDVREYLEDTFLEDAPLVCVSSVTGQGIEEVKTVLDSICGEIPDAPPSGLFRLPVDRVFSMHGFGTVITGTLASGKVEVSDPVVLYPSGIKSKVRGIQVHNDSVNQARSGMRTAVNFQGLEKESVERGQVLASPDALFPSYMVDVKLKALDSLTKPIKNRQRVRFHTGTSEIMGIAALLDVDELHPGQTGFAQIRLDAPVAVVKDDFCVLRSYSPVNTIGGGPILNPIPPKHKAHRKEVIEHLERLSDATPEELVDTLADSAGYSGASFAQLLVMTNLTVKKLQDACQKLLSRKVLVTVDRESKVYLHKNLMDHLEGKAGAYLESYHKANPLKDGMSKEELKSKFPPVLNPKAFHMLLEIMTGKDAIAVEEDTVRLASHTVSLAVDEAELREQIADAYEKGGLTPPYFKEVAAGLPVDASKARDILMHMVSEKTIVKVKEDLFFDSRALEGLKQRLVEFLRANKEITTPQFKEMTGASRKYVIPLLEFFDSNKVTLRVGDSRQLREA